MCDPLSVAASVLAVAGFATKSCQCVFQTVSRFSEGPEEWKSHLVALQDLQLILESIATLEEDAVPAAFLASRFRSRLEACMLDLRSIEELARSTHAHFESGKAQRAWTRLKWSLGDQRQTLKSHLRRIQSYHQAFSLDLLLLNVRLGTRIATEISTRKEYENALTTRRDTREKYSPAQDELSLCSSSWNISRLNWICLSVCAGEVSTPHGTSAGKSWAKRGDGILLSGILLWPIDFRIDLLISYLHTQSHHSFSFNLCFNVSFPRIVPYGTRIFHLVRVGDVKGAREELHNERSRWTEVLPSGDTLLHVAASNRCPNMVAFLLENGARVDVYNNDGDTPLHRAVSASKSYDVCRLLLDHRSNILSCNADGQTALHTFANQITEQIMRSRSCEIDFSISDNYGRTVFHYLAWSSKTHPETFRRYQPLGGSTLRVGDLDIYGCSPLHLAAQRGNVDLVAYFLSTSENTLAWVKSPDGLGRTVLHHGVESIRAAETLTVLHSHLSGEDTSTYDCQGHSPLHHAVYHGNLLGVKALLDLEICTIKELGQENYSGLMPLEIARKRKDGALEAFLEEKGSHIPSNLSADIQVTRKDGPVPVKSYREAPGHYESRRRLLRMTSLAVCVFTILYLAVIFNIA